MDDEKCSTGLGELDEFLRGGLPRKRLYLVQGEPGAGKTTLALQFLLEGVRTQERCLYVTLSETKDELLQVIESHAWALGYHCRLRPRGRGTFGRPKKSRARCLSRAK